MSIEKLKNKIKSYAIKNNLTVQEAWDKYFFDSLLIKLSLSNYKDNFVLKGGFLLENIIGIQNRTTYKCQVKNGQKCAVKIPQFDSILTYL